MVQIYIIFPNYTQWRISFITETINHRARCRCKKRTAPMFLFCKGCEHYVFFRMFATVFSHLIMKPKIIVTGGTGYIGSHTIIELIKNG